MANTGFAGPRRRQLAQSYQRLFLHLKSCIHDHAQDRRGLDPSFYIWGKSTRNHPCREPIIASPEVHPFGALRNSHRSLCGKVSPKHTFLDQSGRADVCSIHAIYPDGPDRP
jgi:hypothetical protein